MTMKPNRHSRKSNSNALALKGWRLAIRYVILGILALLFLFPFYLIFKGAFSTPKGFASAEWTWWPELLKPSYPGTWHENIDKIFANKSVNLAGSFVNSIIVSVIQTTLTIVLAMMVGYAMARFTGWKAKLLHVMTLVTMMIPAAVTFIPMFVITAYLGWIDSYRGLIIPGMFSAMAAYMFRSYFLGFPRELEEAALIDGASPWTLFWRIVVPNSKGIIAAVTSIIFIGSWNAFLWPMLISRENTKTVQVAISQFMTSQGVNYPALFTGALLVILPVLILFLLLQRHLIEGVERSGLSGD